MSNNLKNKGCIETTENLWTVAWIYNKDISYCPRCLKKSLLMRVYGRKCFQCLGGGYQVSPTANTIFHKSNTPLKGWFWLIRKMSKGNVVIKDVERKLNITYKTAFRMVHAIRKDTVINSPNTLKYITMQPAPKISQASEKRSGSTTQPPGMLKMLNEIVELATDQNKIPIGRSIMKLLIHFFKERKLTYVELLEICETIEKLAVSKSTNKINADVTLTV